MEGENGRCHGREGRGGDGSREHRCIRRYINIPYRSSRRREKKLTHPETDPKSRTQTHAMLQSSTQTHAQHTHAHDIAHNVETLANK